MAKRMKTVKVKGRLAKALKKEGAVLSAVLKEEKPRHLEQTWEEAAEEAKADTVRAIRDIAAKLKAENKAIPVESEKPGLARVPKVPKAPVKVHPEEIPLAILSHHLLGLMERLAAEQGGPHARALDELKAAITLARKAP